MFGISVVCMFYMFFPFFVISKVREFFYVSKTIIVLVSFGINRLFVAVFLVERIEELLLWELKKCPAF